MNREQYLAAFEATTQKMLEITKAKNADYSGENAVDAFANFKVVDTIGVATVEQGFITRITDKLLRIVNLTKQEAHVKDEAIEDTLIDMANYCILMKLYLDSKRG